MSKFKIPDGVAASVNVKTAAAKIKHVIYKGLSNPIASDRFGVFKDYMLEVNKIDSVEPYEKPSLYKFNLVSR